MDGNGEKKKIRQYLSTWSFPVVVLVVVFLVLIFLAGWFLCLESNRNYGQLATSLITAAGVVLTLSMTQARAIEQQEREDKRHHARLESEAKMQDERLRIESEREHERLISEAQKDRVQRSITQRIYLAEKLAETIEHLFSENELKQAAGVQEILFQIDDWNALIKTEIAEIKEEGEGVESRKEALRKESLRHRQELFDIAYKFDTETEKVELLKSRARGLKQRLVEDGDHSLAELDFSGMVIGRSSSVKNNDFQVDLAGVFARDFIMTNSEMCFVDLSYAHLEGADLSNAHLEKASLQCVHLEGAALLEAHLEGAALLEAHLEGAALLEAHLEGADLSYAHLEGADLSYAHLEEVALLEAHLEGADLSYAHLEGADLPNAHLERADLSYAHLEEANLQWAYLEETNLQCAHLEKATVSFYMKEAHLERANLSYAHLEEANLQCAYLEEANLQCADLERADLSWAHLERANLSCAHLEEADLLCAYLEGADLSWAHLEGAVLRSAHLEGADLGDAYFDWNALRDKNLLDKSCYDGQTVFPKGFNPKQYGMILVDKKDVS